MLDAFEEKHKTKPDAKKLLNHLLKGRREQDFKGRKPTVFEPTPKPAAAASTSVLSTLKSSDSVASSPHAADEREGDGDADDEAGPVANRPFKKRRT
jgi:hypothetical protein